MAEISNHLRSDLYPLKWWLRESALWKSVLKGQTNCPIFKYLQGILFRFYGDISYMYLTWEGGVVRLRVTANSSVLWSRIRKGSLDNNIESYWDYHCNRQAAFLTDHWSHKTIIWYSSICWRPLSELGLLKENFHSISWRSPLMIMKFLV